MFREVPQSWKWEEKVGDFSEWLFDYVNAHTVTVVGVVAILGIMAIVLVAAS